MGKTTNKNFLDMKKILKKKTKQKVTIGVQVYGGKYAKKIY